jgi:hypothetical protein
MTTYEIIFETANHHQHTMMEVPATDVPTVVNSVEQAEGEVLAIHAHVKL